MNRAAIALLLALALLLDACGSPKAASTVASAARTLPSSPTSFQPSSTNASFGILPVPGGVSAASATRLNGITCSGPIGPSDPVAVVVLHTGEIVLRDYADPRSPRTACHFPGQVFGIQLIDAHHVVIPSNDAGFLFAVVDLPEARYHWFQLPATPATFPYFVAVSPGLSEVAWLSSDLSASDQVHLTNKSGDHVVATVPATRGRCGSADDSKLGSYAVSGTYLFVLDQPVPFDNSLIVLRGEQKMLSDVPPSGGWQQGAQPGMALWSPTSGTLFYRQNGDVWKWTPAGGAQRYLSGVSWYYPTISADGSDLAYSVVRSDGLHNIYLIDLAHGGSPQLTGKGARNLPVFLNSTQLWYKTESQGICGPGGNQPLIYDITDGSEAPSIIDQPLAVWPATSSNF